MQSCLICDDHPLVADALAGLIARRWPDALLTQAADFPTAAAAIADWPAVCITDLAMPGATPIEGVRRLRALSPDTRIIVVTGLDDDRLMDDLAAAGVCGIVAKNSPPAMIVPVIELVLAGGRYLPERQAVSVADAVPAITLSARQHQVASLLAQGHSNKAIARELGVAPATVKTHVAHILALFGAENRTAAARRFQQLGLPD